MVESEWIDISVPFPVDKPMPYFPTDPQGPSITRIFDRTKGDPVTMSQININSHNGTHIDSPFHFMAEGTTIDMMPLDTAIGPARVIEIKDPNLINPEELEGHNIRAGERVLFKTINSSYYKQGKFVEDFVHITKESAHFIADKNISVVGIDYLAVGSFRDRSSLIEVHQILLGNGIWIVEALDLSRVEPGDYEIICLPIKIKQGDAGQARAIIRPL